VNRCKAEDRIQNRGSRIQWKTWNQQLSRRFGSSGFCILTPEFQIKDLQLLLLKHFKSVPTMTADEVRSFLEKHDPEEFNLVDVRQPSEYEDKHIPGTKLIPLSELEDRLEELDPTKPTVAY
jgi:hypothetical protein